MNRTEFKKIIRGVSMAVPTPFDSEYKLDLAGAADLTRFWVENGLGTDKSMIKLCSAWGQGPDISDEEWPHLVRTVVNAGGTGVNVMCGLKSKDTMRTIEDAKIAQDMGANSLQIELPYNHAPNQDQYVKHFTMISDAIDIGIMIYNTYWFGVSPIEPETMERLKDAEHVAAIKWNYPTEDGYDRMKEFSGEFNVIDNSGYNVRCRKNGGAGMVSAFGPAYPKHDLKVWELLENGKYEEADALKNSFAEAVGPALAKISSNSGGYRAARGMMELVGQPVGPPRLPTEPLTSEELSELKVGMQKLGWLD